ncbi:hypothetical protein TCAL_14303 [Tigriopus californicus]|uniref:C2H2-type domain-containing protein n=1 Tax=Tigriopus californicus TaxID=6832 RepID=A0A553NE67_TIGCA|nr:hypothetical protein TCAL_14303 [Tigriopus californicus]
MALNHFISFPRLGSNAWIKFIQRPTSTSTQDLISYACSICGAPCKSQAGLNYHYIKRHSGKLSSYLRRNPVETYVQIFGTNYKSLSTRELRYANGLVVTLEGKHRGFWYSFVNGQGGGPLKAISHALDTANFSETMKMALQISGLKPSQFLDLQMEDDFEAVNPDTSIWDATKMARINTAKSIWSACEPLKGTLAARYLIEHRKIPTQTLSLLFFKFLGPSKGYREFIDSDTYETKTNGNPALVVPVQDGFGTLTGVQRIYLDSMTGNKFAKYSRTKFSKGVIKNSAAVIQKAQFNQPLILCEGPETGASLAAAFPHVSVLASLSLANLQGCGEVVKAQSPSQVIVAGDLDDNVANQELLRFHFQSLQDQMDVEIRLIVPCCSLRKHGDWNDILIDQGISEIKRQIRL